MVNQTYDNYVATHGTIFVSGAGNGGPPISPSTSYNGISVAAFGGGSSVGPTLDNGRSKPDITAPATYTSYSSPLVSGAAAILVQAAGTIPNANDPRTVKALLLNGAVKPLYQSAVADRWTHTDTAPLDSRYGVGVLNVFNSYKQFQGGRHPFTTSTTSTIPPGTGGNVPARAGWDFNSLSSTSTADKVNHYFFNLTGGPSDTFTATATLTWNRQNGQSAVNNLDFYLYGEDGTLYASSVSTVDNVEHLFLQALPPGRYDLQVFKRRNDLVSPGETYALAFNFAPMRLTGAASRKTHSGAGSFDLPLPLTGTPGIECRRGAVEGEHQVVLNFAVPVTFSTAETTTGAANVTSASGSGTNSITVNLSGVTNAQTTALTLFGTNDGDNITDVTVKMSVLLGDVNGSGRVDSGDVTMVRENNLEAPNSGNFRSDANTSGRIDSGDVTIVRQQNLTGLP